MGAMNGVARAALRLASAIAPLALLAGAAPARADETERWRLQIDEASQRFGVPARWIEQVMRAESAGQTRRGGRPIRSHAGAMGLMQLMPATWSAMRARLGLGADPDDPRDNILAGAFYLRLMYDRFGYPGLFGAYNAGPERYAAYLEGTRRLPRETVTYLATVTDGVSRGIPSLGSDRASGSGSGSIAGHAVVAVPGAGEARRQASSGAANGVAGRSRPKLFVVAKGVTVASGILPPAAEEDAANASLFAIRKGAP
ncbi:MAG: lytic transglycosylase domain-containing protein [Sphingomonadales bacterium]|nr:MAG: lytic transglycosylase domain-containing protein [Sphingomonadales bacterium]